MERGGHVARVVIDLDYLRDFLNLGRRYAVQERHEFLDYLFARALFEIDCIKHAESLEPQPRPSSAACEARDLQTLIDLARRREKPGQD